MEKKTLNLRNPDPDLYIFTPSQKLNWIFFSICETSVNLIPALLENYTSKPM